jgi:UDP-galactopyranose mutase
MNWLEGKLPMPNLIEILIKNITREHEDNMIHSSFFYPKEGGSQFIVDRLKNGLSIYNEKAVSLISKENNKLRIYDDLFDRLIFCGDIRQLPLYCKDLLAKKNIDVGYIENLKSNGTSNLFCEVDNTDISWLDIPESFTKAHRMIYTGNFSETNNRGSSRTTCVVEFSGKVDLQTMEQEIQKLPGNLHILSNNYEPNSYVIQDAKTRETISAAKYALEEHGIYLLGRFAEWEYYNMDKAIEAAFALSDKLNLKN